jgi:hypothetical protein
MYLKYFTLGTDISNFYSSNIFVIICIKDTVDDGR